MRLRVFKQGAIVVLAPEEPIMGEAVAEFSDKVDEVLAEGENKIIVDIGTVPFIDSAGLEMLLDALSKARQAGGKVKVANPNAICADILRVTRLSNFLEVYEETDEARRSFL